MSITERFDEILKEEFKKKKLNVKIELKKIKKSNKYLEELNKYFDEIHPY